MNIRLHHAIFAILAIFFLDGFVFSQGQDLQEQDTEEENLPELDSSGQDKFSFGIGPEVNFYTIDGVAAGAAIFGEYHFNKYLSSGLNIGANYDFDSLFTIVPSAFARFYPFSFFGMRPFTQINVGAALLFYESVIYPSLAASLSLGLNIPLTKNLYFEPYIRGGYPFIAGAGIAIGYTVKASQKPDKAQPETTDVAVAEPEKITEPPPPQPKPVVEQPKPKEPPKVVEAPKPAAKPVVIPESEENLIRFDPSSRVIPSRENQKLQQVGAKLKENPSRRIQIAGHTARVGSAAWCMELSLTRAEAVAKYLINNGYISSQQVTICGYGNERPVAPNNSKANRTKNRRAEIIILE